MQRQAHLLTYDPHADDWYVYDYDWYSYPQADSPRTDWEISQRIENELWWSPFVDSDDLDVAVEDGVAQLTGTVETWAERDAAVENALKGGAASVDEDLTVEFGTQDGGR